ncbi:hypothetical protein [Actinoplanes solisilvae]|uniref:hypothetical protein n=1 Tax=Actinoplanes solisilvae TaxID=2486853 RepID=UPI000FDA5EE2|nr:hypothetical protein [Actinoplanes solisilvae]
MKPRWPSIAALAVALAAGTALITGSIGGSSAPIAPTRTSALSAWPDAARGEMAAGLDDGPLFSPSMFLDTATAIGTAPAPNGAETRLLVRSPAGMRELRRVSLADNPQFEAFTATDDQLFWAESTAASPAVRLWTAPRAGGAARLLTRDTGSAVFYGTQYDLVVAEGRLRWTAAAGSTATQIRSIPVGGGSVSVRTEPGQWSQSAWPWLVDDGSTSGEPRLRNLATNRDVAVANSGLAQLTCNPSWCRAMIMGEETPAAIELVRPDGSDRRRIAGGAAQAAVTDVAILDRFEILAEPGPASDVTGASGLVVYDLATGRTVDIAPNVDGAFARGGLLWWSTTGDYEEITWHTLDLRTV